MGTTSAPRIAPPRPPLGLADALFGRVRKRVLTLLFGQPDRSFYANEIIDRVDTGTGAVQRELARLEAAGLVTVLRIDRQKHYKANGAAPIFAELRGIVLKTTGLREVLVAALSHLEHDTRAAFVFGSIAKGEDTAGSDVDLMVISDHVTYAELFATLDRAASQLSRQVHLTIYASADLLRRIDEDRPFVTRVLDQPKIWIIGSEGDLSA